VDVVPTVKKKGLIGRLKLSEMIKRVIAKTRKVSDFMHGILAFVTVSA
jgi:hypothetical protein